MGRVRRRVQLRCHVHRVRLPDSLGWRRCLAPSQLHCLPEYLAWVNEVKPGRARAVVVLTTRRAPERFYAIRAEVLRTTSRNGGSGALPNATPPVRCQGTAASRSPDSLHVDDRRFVTGASRYLGVAGQERCVETFSQCDVRGVVGGEVLAQLVDATEEGFVFVAMGAERGVDIEASTASAVDSLPALVDRLTALTTSRSSSYGAWSVSSPSRSATSAPSVVDSRSSTTAEASTTSTSVALPTDQLGRRRAQRSAWRCRQPLDQLGAGGRRRNPLQLAQSELRQRHPGQRGASLELAVDIVVDVADLQHRHALSMDSCREHALSFDPVSPHKRDVRFVRRHKRRLSGSRGSSCTRGGAGRTARWRRC